MTCDDVWVHKRVVSDYGSQHIQRAKVTFLWQCRYTMSMEQWNPQVNIYKDIYIYIRSTIGLIFFLQNTRGLDFACLFSYIHNMTIIELPFILLCCDICIFFYFLAISVCVCVCVSLYVFTQQLYNWALR